MTQPLFSMPPYDWANSGSAAFFGGCGEYGFSTVRVGVILRNGYGIQGRNFLELLQESEMAAGCHCRNWT